VVVPLTPDSSTTCHVQVRPTVRPNKRKGQRAKKNREKKKKSMTATILSCTVILSTYEKNTIIYIVNINYFILCMVFFLIKNLFPVIVTGYLLGIMGGKK
jgi:hypothetical protein